jgi:ubiquinone/menaquinone biosynthesis C-methylase UbiE
LISDRYSANRAFYDRISRSYDMIADAGEQKARETGEALLAAQPGETILEIGYGTGHSSVALANAVAPDGRVLGIDVSPGMRKVAQARVEKNNLQAFVDLALGDARNLPYPDSSIDGVFMSFILELFAPEEIPVVLAEIRRVLRAGGRFANVSMAKVPEGERESLLERTYVWMHRHFPHIVDCRPIDAEHFLAASGFYTLEEKAMTIWTMPVLAILAAKGR